MKMRNFWCVFFIVSLLADHTDSLGKQTQREMTGTLGGSITFHLETSKQPTKISWLRIREVRPVHIASTEAGHPCRITIVVSEFEGRLNVSGDCKNLQISNLEQGDSGLYTAQIGEHPEDFMLKVYKNLSESDLEVGCENDTLSEGNYTLQLNCSAGKWEDGVNYTWTSQSISSKISSRVVQIQDGEANYTCAAQNPVSQASKTVSVKQACEAAHPTTRPETVASTDSVDLNKKSEHSSTNQLLLWIFLPIVVIVLAALGSFLWKKKKRAARSMPPDPTGCAVPEESSKTIYAQIDCLPPGTQQTGTKKPQPRQRSKTKDGLHTVYASVVQPKPTPLQTDDEKIQMEGQGASKKSDKTIYSTLTKPQETDDPSIKTLYDTVNAPRCPEGSEFHKLL